ncbi:ribonuclease H-like domain-containing protein [Luteolibacter sp. AS25]|uniref:ribonuclease H-like domain-containing protein n=1 Tax=Luteolibacter sp. AS25 TaxID=3135776 RepID=UPI00398AA4BA
MPEKNIVYFDLETQRSISDVGGFANKAKLCISVAVTYSTATGEYVIFGEDDADALASVLLKADLVVGWNHLGFDYPVLQPYVLQDLAEQTLNLDMMLDVKSLMGRFLKLDNVASTSLGTGKSADGLDAIRWWQAHKKTGDYEPLGKIAEYCAYDVKVTRFVHEFGMRNGFIKYEDAGNIIELPVNW